MLSGAAALVALAAVATACGPSPDASPQPHVVTVDDAVRPLAGRDYRLVTTLRGADARGAGDITSSGEVVVTTGPLMNGTGGEFHLTLLDPVSGHRRRLPDGLGRVVDADRRTVTFSRYVPGSRGRLVMDRLDRSSGRVRHFEPPLGRGRFMSVLGLQGDVVWYSTARDAQNDPFAHVYSVRFGHPGTVQHHGRRSWPTYADGTLTWVVGSRHGPDTLATQDLADGRVTRVTLPEDCRVRPSSSDLLSNGRQLVVDATCGRTFVLDRDRGVVATLRVEGDEGALEMSARTASFYWYSYDLASGTLYDVSDRTLLAGLPPTTGPGARPLALWPQGSDGPHDNPTRVLVVRLL